MNLEIDKFEKIFNFPSVVYTHYRPDFLDLVKPVFNEYVETAKTLKNNNNDIKEIINNIQFFNTITKKLKYNKHYGIGHAGVFFNNQQTRII